MKFRKSLNNNIALAVDDDGYEIIIIGTGVGFKNIPCKKIKELGLTESDMPDGYYIQNTSEEVKTFILDDQTSYTFFDVGNLFVKEEDDKKYTTTSQDEFKTFLYGEKAGDDPRRTPFEVEVSAEKVISIQEIFVN